MPGGDPAYVLCGLAVISGLILLGGLALLLAEGAGKGRPARPEPSLKSDRDLEPEG